MAYPKTPEKLFDIFLERVTEGRAGINVCKDDDMPGWTTVWRKITSDPDFEQRYRTALSSRGMVYADMLDELDKKLLSGKITESAHRTLSDNIKWRSARMTPKVYGDKQQVDVTASPGGEYLQALQQINNNLEMRRVEAIEHEEGETHITETSTRAQSERSK
tara:strand:- start:172 stop:657 length:486 start_codon:yes stop_codon:yes gene_type:complete